MARDLDAERMGSATVVGVGLLGAGAAFGALVVLGYLGVGDYLVIGVFLVAPWTFLAAIAGCGLVVALAAASGRTHRSAWRRAQVAMVVLGVVGVTAVATRGGPLNDFDAGDWRAATAEGDLDAMETQAYRAVEEEALVGLDRAAVRRTLGEPERRRRRDTLWLWDLGMINDTFGPGDAGGLRVTFDRATGRVRAAEVG